LVALAKGRKEGSSLCSKENDLAYLLLMLLKDISSENMQKEAKYDVSLEKLRMENQQGQ